MLFSRLTTRKPSRRARRLQLEPLEGRVVLSVAFDSALGVGNEGARITANDNAVDAAGNTYVTGMFTGTADFDPAADRPDGSDILTARGTHDAFVAKYAPDNTLLWARRMGSGQTEPFRTETAYGLALDGAGNAHVIGRFAEVADFGPFTLTSAGHDDAYVAKLDANGNFLWARRWGGAGRDSGSAIAVDAAGNVVTATSTYGVPKPNTYVNTGFEVRKFSPTGTPLWSKRVDAAAGHSTAVAIDAAGNIHVGGGFSGKVDFNPDPRKTTYVSALSGTSNSVYVLTLTSSGAFTRVSPFLAKSTSSSVSCSDLAVDATGSIIVGGGYSGAVDFNPNSSAETRLPANDNSSYIAKLSSAGTLSWATPLQGATVSALALDASGAIYATGEFSGVYSPGFGLPPATTNGRSDVHVTKLTASGAASWAVTFGGTTFDYGRSIALDGSGTVYVAGNYASTVDFDPDPLGVHELSGTAGANMYLLKLRRR